MSPYQQQISISEVQELNGRLIEIETNLEKISRSMHAVQTTEIWSAGMLALLMAGSIGVVIGLWIH